MIERLRRRTSRECGSDSWHRDSLTFVEHTEPIALFDREVLDRVLRFIPALDVGLLVHDQGAEVARVEHDDVRDLQVRIDGWTIFTCKSSHVLVDREISVGS